MSGTCIGYGEREGTCTRPAGTPWTDLWCRECDEARRLHISAQLAKIEARFSGVTPPEPLPSTRPATVEKP